jgi:hypothetical protein
MADTLIALLSLVLSVSLAVFYIRDRRHTKFTLETEYVKSLLAWHEEVVVVLMRARHLKRERQSEQHKADLACLSGLIEQGRFFFPNIERADGFGDEKPPAYRGYRNLALDFLVASYNVLQDNVSKKSTEQLDLLQRHFTSVVFELVRPKDRLNTIRALTDRYFAKEESFEDFLEHGDSSIIKHIWRGRS